MDKGVGYHIELEFFFTTLPILAKLNKAYLQRPANHLDGRSDGRSSGHWGGRLGVCLGGR